MGKKAVFLLLCLKKKKVCLCSRRWSGDNWCCLVAAVVVLIVVAVVGIASWHDAAAVFFGCVRQDVTHDTFIGTSWLWNYRQMWLSGYSALTLETSAPGLPGYYVNYNNTWSSNNNNTASWSPIWNSLAWAKSQPHQPCEPSQRDADGWWLLGLAMWKLIIIFLSLTKYFETDATHIRISRSPVVLGGVFSVSLIETRRTTFRAGHLRYLEDVQYISVAVRTVSFLVPRVTPWIPPTMDVLFTMNRAWGHQCPVMLKTSPNGFGINFISNRHGCWMVMCCTNPHKSGGFGDVLHKSPTIGTSIPSPVEPRFHGMRMDVAWISCDNGHGILSGSARTYRNPTYRNPTAWMDESMVSHRFSQHKKWFGDSVEWTFSCDPHPLAINRFKKPIQLRRSTINPTVCPATTSPTSTSTDFRCLNDPVCSWKTTDILAGEMEGSSQKIGVPPSHHPFRTMWFSTKSTLRCELLGDPHPFWETPHLAE